MTSLGELVVSFRANISQLTSAVEQVREELAAIGSHAATANEQVSTGFLGSVRSMLSFGSNLGLTLFGLKDLAQTAFSTASALLAPDASMEQTETAFRTLLGSTSAARKELAALSQMAAATPFEFPDLAEAEQQLIAFQIPLQETHPLLLAIGDALSGLGRNTPATLSQVVQVFGQMHAAGKIQTQDLLQLTTVGINAFQILADQMHVPISRLREMVSAGLIPADKGIEMLRQGMEQTFGGSMQAQSLTFNGLMSTLSDNISLAWRTISGPLFDQAKQALIQLGNLVSSPAFQNFAKLIGQRLADAFKFLSSHGDLLRAVLIGLGGVLATILIPALVSFGAGLLATIGPFVAIGAAIAGAVLLFQRLFAASPAFRQFVETVRTGLGQLWVHLQQQLGPALQQFSSLWQTRLLPALQAGGNFFNTTLLPILHQLGTLFTTVLAPSIQQVGNFFQSQFLPLVNQLAQQLQSLLLPAWQQLQQLWTGTILPALQQLRGSLQQLMPLFQLLGGILLGALVGGFILLVGVINGVLHALVPLITGLMTAFAGIIQTINGVFQVISGLVQFFTDLFTGHFEKLGTDLGAIWRGIQTMLGGIWQTISGVFQGIFGGIVQFISGWLQGILNVVSRLFPGFTQALGGLGAWWGTFWSGLGQFVLNLIQGLLQGGQNFIAGLISIFQNGLQLLLSVILAPFQAIVTAFAWLYQHNYYFQWLIDHILAIVRGGLAFLQGLWQGAINGLLGLWQWLVGIAQQRWSDLVNTIRARLSEASAVVSNVGHWIVSALQNAWNTVVSDVRGLWNGVAGVFRNAWNLISGPVSSLASQLTNWASGLAQKALQWGSNLIGSFISGISSKIQDVAQTASNIAGQVTRFLGFHSPAEAGPAHTADQWGPRLGTMFAQGLRSTLPAVTEAAQAMAQSLRLSLQAPLSAQLAPVQMAQPALLTASPGTIVIEVQPAPVTLDGRQLAQGLLPHLANTIRYQAPNFFAH